MRDGHNYQPPTKSGCSSGHHFRRISGAGPLIGTGACGAVCFPPGAAVDIDRRVHRGGGPGFCGAGAFDSRAGGQVNCSDCVSGNRAGGGNGGDHRHIVYPDHRPGGFGAGGGERRAARTVTYPAHTRFIAPHGIDEHGKPSSAFIASMDSYDNVIPYRIPSGSVIRYPSGTEVQAGSSFVLVTKPRPPRRVLTWRCIRRIQRAARLRSLTTLMRGGKSPVPPGERLRSS